MRPQQVTLGAAGYSPWLNINRMPQGNFGVALGVELTSGASLTYSVQHTLDPIYTPTYEWSASRTTTTGTITLANHGLSVGDYWEGGAPAPFNTSYAVASVTDANIFTVTTPNSGVTSVLIGLYPSSRGHVFEHATLTTLTASANGNYAFPPTACRLIISTYSSGKATLNVIQVG